MPTKGSPGMFAVDKCLEFIKELGDNEGNIIVKNDKEPSIQFLINDFVKAGEDGQTVLEESPVKSSGSNGIIERSQGVEGQMGAFFLALKREWGREWIQEREL